MATTSTHGSQPPQPSGDTSLGMGLGPVRDRVAALLDSVADVVRFSFSSVRSLAKVRLYTSEAFRQTGVMILSSGVVIWFMEFTIGAVFGMDGGYLVSQFGVRDYAAIIPALGDLRACSPLMWGWILSAKVGCGQVAELGSMRISEEIDAMEVMGVRPVPYLIGTRLLAAWIAMPFLYLVGLGLSYIGSYLMLVDVLKDVSVGGYFSVFWIFQSPLDLMYSTLWTIILGTFVILISCYYGFNATGGPVGVGKNTAKSMAVNMVLVSIISMFCQQLFWGGFPNAPIAN
jgi:phospholipid/cholesterol/gamma-HCH transport system permease protein